MIPSQKFGVDRPQSATPLAIQSQARSFFTAATTPAGMPIRQAMTKAIVPSCSVTGSFSSTSSETGRWMRIDSPKSPCSTPPSQ